MFSGTLCRFRTSLTIGFESFSMYNHCSSFSFNFRLSPEMFYTYSTVFFTLSLLLFISQVFCIILVWSSSLLSRISLYIYTYICIPSVIVFYYKCSVSTIILSAFLKRDVLAEVVAVLDSHHDGQN